MKTGHLKKRQKYIQIFIKKMFKKMVYFFNCILPNYMAHDITKEFEKIGILKIWQLVSLLGVKTQVSKLTSIRNKTNLSLILGSKICLLNINVSSVVEFQRWWVLKSKTFAQESTCSKEILIPSTLNYLWSSVVGVVKVDYLDFPCEILCEFDVRIIACNF